MAIEEQKFVNEDELQKWVEENINSFFGDVLYAPGNFMIYTKRDKGAKPDGFILDLENSSWTIIESELLHHGVWNHIAEQLIRFVVASKTDVAKRKIRNQFFNIIERKNLIKVYSEKLEIPEFRLIQQIENILENETPDLALFIDEIDDDLQDMIEALNATVRVFKVKKYLVNGSIEYQSPEGTKSTIETVIEEVKDARGNKAEALELLGGGKLIGNMGGIKFYGLESGEKVSIKYSKCYDPDTNPGYWFGITPSALEKYKKHNISHLVFILSEEGVVKLPFNILQEYINQAANVTMDPDGRSVKHFHIFMRIVPHCQLFTSKSKRIWAIDEYFYCKEE